MASSQPDITELKSRMKDTWMAGDFGEIARFTVKTAEEFAARLNIAPGSNILDVACGTGNTVIPLARAGVRMIGVDIAPNLLEQARARAHKERLKVGFREGDAEQLGFPDVMFDGVISMFGAMFAPRPELVVTELLRVVRPGGMIAMANWTPEGFTGQMFKVTARHVPPPPGVPPPILWGDEATVKQRFGAGVKDLRCTRVACDFEFPFPPAEVVQFFRRYFGPTQTAFARLDSNGQAALAADLEKLWSDHNQRNDGTTLVRSEYLEVVATRV
ncbi:MAG: class I SAM-dependent methyltransferase [Acidobacteriia bacterium]|nr:class I SAM-dependent methyltransferase [Terriglobia bacterium]